MASNTRSPGFPLEPSPLAEAEARFMEAKRRLLSLISTPLVPATLSPNNGLSVSTSEALPPATLLTPAEPSVLPLQTTTRRDATKEVPLFVGKDQHSPLALSPRPKPQLSQRQRRDRIIGDNPKACRNTTATRETLLAAPSCYSVSAREVATAPTSNGFRTSSKISTSTPPADKLRDNMDINSTSRNYQRTVHNTVNSKVLNSNDITSGHFHREKVPISSITHLPVAQLHIHSEAVSSTQQPTRSCESARVGGKGTGPVITSSALRGGVRSATTVRSTVNNHHDKKVIKQQPKLPNELDSTRFSPSKFSRGTPSRQTGNRGVESSDQQVVSESPSAESTPSNSIRSGLFSEFVSATSSHDSVDQSKHSDEVGNDDRLEHLGDSPTAGLSSAWRFDKWVFMKRDETELATQSTS